MKIIEGKFGVNVFEPLYEHLCKGHFCAKLVAQSIDAFAKKDFQKISELCKIISTTESQADQIEIAIRNKLSNSIFAAIKRENILHILKFQDNICDSAEDVAKLLSIRQTYMPEKCKPILKKLANKVESTVDSLLVCSAKLADIKPDGSEQSLKRNKKTVPVLLEDVRRKEELTDVLIHDFTKKLFECEKKSDPVSVMLLFNLARMIGKIADAAENAADSYVAFI